MKDPEGSHFQATPTLERTRKVFRQIIPYLQYYQKHLHSF